MIPNTIDIITTATVVFCFRFLPPDFRRAICVAIWTHIRLKIRAEIMQKVLAPGTSTLYANRA
jgi:hypothetical protein